jgi:hypothetical protein
LISILDTLQKALVSHVKKDTNSQNASIRAAYSMRSEPFSPVEYPVVIPLKHEKDVLYVHTGL